MEVNILKNEKNELEFEADCDASVAELLVNRMNRNSAVVFAAYRIGHPITAKPRVIVKTSGKDALGVALAELEGMADELAEFRKAFRKSK